MSNVKRFLDEMLEAVDSDLRVQSTPTLVTTIYMLAAIEAGTTIECSVAKDDEFLNTIYQMQSSELWMTFIVFDA